jgi:hypothetical protein
LQAGSTLYLEEEFLPVLTASRHTTEHWIETVNHWLYGHLLGTSQVGDCVTEDELHAEPIAIQRRVTAHAL